MHDLSNWTELKTFPYESVCAGLAYANKTVFTANSDEFQKIGLRNVPYLKMTNSQKRWYLAIKHGCPIEGWTVNITESVVHENWFQFANPEIWSDSYNYKFFEPLRNWIATSNLFDSVGRIIFFLTTVGQHTPAHTDYTSYGDTIPAKYKDNRNEFIWLTDPNNMKRLLVGNQLAPSACWFDALLTHETLPSPRTQWSLRIDGNFTETIRQRFTR